MTLAYTVAAQSKDTSTKVGSVIVGPKRDVRATGYNGAPRGFDDSDPRLLVRPDKYLFSEHSERNSIYQCARNGTSCEGTTLYVSWLPCLDCARGIIQSGIAKVVIHRTGHMAYLLSQGDQHQWDSAIAMSEQTMRDCGVLVEWLSKPLPLYVIGQFNGRRYRFNADDPSEVCAA